MNEGTRGEAGRIEATVTTSTFDPELIKTLVRESRASQGLPPTIEAPGFHRLALATVDRVHETRARARAREAASQPGAA